MDTIMEGSTHLSQCYDVINNLSDILNTQNVHQQFLQSLSNVMKGKRSEIHHKNQLLVEQMNEVMKRTSFG